MLTFRTIYWDYPVQEGRTLDLFAPMGAESRDKALFFIHGGGWRSGSRTIFHRIALAFCELGFDCASTDYRLKGVTIDEQVADVRHGLQLFAQDLQERGRPSDIVIIGSSAGSHLALLSALREGAPEFIRGLCVQSAPFSFEPWEDIFPAIWEAMQTAVGRRFQDDPERFRAASPLHLVREGMPPIFALQAENEHMFPLALARQFAEAASKLGARVELKVYPSTEHGFFYALERRRQKEAFADILNFIESL